MQTNLHRIPFEAVQAPDGQSMRLDLSLSDYMARVTVGHLGTGRNYCDTEILSIDTEQTVHGEHHEFEGAHELRDALTKFFAYLRDLSGPLPAAAGH